MNVNMQDRGRGGKGCPRLAILTPFPLRHWLNRRYPPRPVTEQEIMTPIVFTSLTHDGR